MFWCGNVFWHSWKCNFEKAGAVCSVKCVFHVVGMSCSAMRLQLDLLGQLYAPTTFQFKPIPLAVYGNAVGLPVPWLGWWWGANLKAITPPYELYYHCWLIIALGRGARGSLVLVSFFIVSDMIFMRTGANTLDFLWCPFVSHRPDGAEVVR